MGGGGEAGGFGDFLKGERGFAEEDGGAGDARTNRILLNGRNVDVDYIETLVLEFDQPAEVESLLTKRLRYFSVIDFLDVAAGGLERYSSRGASGGAAGGIAFERNRAGNRQRDGRTRAAFCAAAADPANAPGQVACPAM